MPISLSVLLAELNRREEQAALDAKRRQEEAAARAAEEAAAEEKWARTNIERCADIVRRLRASYHPKQDKAFRRSKRSGKRKAVKTTRRAGKTSGGCRETLARSLERRERWVYVNETRAEAKRLVWRSDSRDGWCDLLEQYGFVIAHTRKEFLTDRTCDVLINETDLTIDFRNGSQLTVFTADRMDEQEKFRGGEKDGVWVDEAQKFNGLSYFVDEIVIPALAKPGGESGELWLTGTPSRVLSGLFYETTKEPDQGERAQGWDVHEFSVVDNPRYGATERERWDATAGAVLEEKGWDVDDPPPGFVREWLGRWTKGDALYVYAVHARPPHEFAPSRVDAETGRYDHSLAVADLPETILDERERVLRIRWFYALGADFGSDPAAFAWTLWGFSPDVADIYEMGSWKMPGLLPRAMRNALVSVWKQCQDRLAVCVGDAGGALAKVSLQGWAESTGLPIQAADKHGKRTWQEHYNGELYAGNMHYRQGSILLAEQRELQWKPAKAKPGEADVETNFEEWPERRLPDGSRCGSDASDSALYPYRHLIARRLEFARTPQSSEERIEREEARMLEAARRSTKRAMTSGAMYDD